MIRLLHPIAGTLALVTVAAFWISTVLGEVFGSQALVVTIKETIPWGFLILIPALAAAGGTGFKASRGARAGLVGAKAKRMPFIALNGILVLIPAAFFLSYKAQSGDFDTSFYVVQGLEIIAGAANITLLGLNMRDGMKLRGRRRRNSA